MEISTSGEEMLSRDKPKPLRIVKRRRSNDRTACFESNKVGAFEGPGNDSILFHEQKENTAARLTRKRNSPASHDEASA